ncbi:DUF3187 domain-containing protein [Hydrogenimonas sp.]
MNRIAVLLLATAVSLFAYSDRDLDGVDDAVDLCPNTPIMDLVDSNGCSIRSLVREYHFDIVLGGGFSRLDYRLDEKSEIYTTSLQVDYYSGDFSLQLTTSYFRSSDFSGMDDTTLALYYRWKLSQKLTLMTGAGIVFPTYDSETNSNGTDYTVSANLSYAVGAYNLFGGGSFTRIGDDDTPDIAYRNVKAFSLGAGRYFSESLYASLAYNRSDSIYRDVDAIESGSLYLFYTIDRHWFTTVDCAAGLSDTASDYRIELKVGYYF